LGYLNYRIFGPFFIPPVWAFVLAILFYPAHAFRKITPVIFQCPIDEDRFLSDRNSSNLTGQKISKVFFPLQLVLIK
jgi:hypothetical protein